MTGYQVVQYRLSEPNWYVHYVGVLDGAGLPRIAAGPFHAADQAEEWIGREIDHERSVSSYWRD